MAKADLGEKIVCPECGEKFYDLNRNPVPCPECGHTFDPTVTAEVAAVVTVKEAADKEGEDGEATEVDEDDIDEDEIAAKELELDGDDSALLADSNNKDNDCLLYTSPSPRDRQKSRMPSSA